MAIAKLRHRLLLCSQADIVTDGDWHVKREGVLNMWAAIEVKAASRWTPNGAAIDKRNSRTHIITTRRHPELNVSVLAWLYEERLKSAPRWFKILSVNETEQKGTQYLMFNVRLTERDDRVATPEAEEPDHQMSPLPDGVAL